MGNLIKQILKEDMISKIDDWEQNLNDMGEGDLFSTLISVDDENGDKLYLFVGFKTTRGDIVEYSYSFILVDKDNKPLSGYEVDRSIVRKFLPRDLVGKGDILPIIKSITRKLLDNTLPIEIHRRTSEKLKDSSLKRYEVITNIMVTEYGYELIKTYVDDEGYTIWVLKRDGGTENMKEVYHINTHDENVVNMVHPYGFVDFSKLKG
jgi:hypothetical protein